MHGSAAAQKPSHEQRHVLEISHFISETVGTASLMTAAEDKISKSNIHSPPFVATVTCYRRLLSIRRRVSGKSDEAACARRREDVLTPRRVVIWHRRVAIANCEYGSIIATRAEKRGSPSCGQIRNKGKGPLPLEHFAVLGTRGACTSPNVRDPLLWPLSSCHHDRSDMIILSVRSDKLLSASNRAR